MPSDLRNELAGPLSSLSSLGHLFSETVSRLSRRPAERLPFPAERTVTAAYAAKVAGLEQPVLRNLLITQAYHDLSGDLAACLRSPGIINWPTMAAWASRRAGQTIRREDLPGEREVVGALDLLPHGDLLSSLVHELSAAIADGNRVVFAEVAPAFARFVDSFSRAEVPNQGKLDRFLATFAPGPVKDGGQEELRQAFGLYHEARFEVDANRKAELIFAANICLAIQEQSRLQPFIERALPHGTAPLATKIFLTLTLSNGTTYRLGEDLPRRPFAEHLRTIEDRALLAQIRRLDKHPDSTEGSGAGRWDSLEDRLAFIIDLFRLHGSDERLFQEPIALSEWWQLSGTVRPPRWARKPARPAAVYGFLPDAIAVR